MDAPPAAEPMKPPILCRRCACDPALRRPTPSSVVEDENGFPDAAPPTFDAVDDRRDAERDALPSSVSLVCRKDTRPPPAAECEVEFSSATSSS